MLLAEQDRTRWDADRIQEGPALLMEALRRAGPTRYSVQAAIAAVHSEAPTWEEALSMTDDDVERSFLARRLDEVASHLH